MPFEVTSSTNVNIKNMKARLSKFETEEGRLKGLDFKPRQSDVVIVTPPKCGTTWMQQILHQLRSGGDMDFNDIYEVIPFIEIAHDIHLDLEAEQRYEPRCYKSHCWYDDCPKGGKYIVIYRDPFSAAYSFYKFFEGWFFQPGEVTLDEFIDDFLLKRKRPTNKMENASYFHHLASWWKYRNNPNVLFLFFEEMKEDLESVVKAVASFIGVESQESIKNAVKMSSFDFMKAHGEKFEENLASKYRNKACGIPDKVLAQKVVTGSTTKAKEVLSDKAQEGISEMWKNVVAKETGFQNYDELRIGFRKETQLLH